MFHALDIFLRGNMIALRAPRRHELDVFNAVAEPQRRAILTLLAADERPVGDIVAALGLAQPSVSKHLRVLRDVGLVDVRRDGRQIFYRTNAAGDQTAPRVDQPVRALLAEPALPHQGTRRAQLTRRGRSRDINGGNHGRSRSSHRKPDAHHHAGNPGPLVARRHLRGAARADGTGQRRARRHADADDPRAVARRPLVPRSGRRATATSGATCRRSSGRRCSRSPAR